MALSQVGQLTRYLSQVGPASNRQVTLNSAAAVEITPTAGTNEMHIYNDIGVNIRYGGSGVTTSTGGLIYPGTTISFIPTSDFSVYLLPESGGDAAIEIVEFA